MSTPVKTQNLGNNKIKMVRFSRDVEWLQLGDES